MMKQPNPAPDVGRPHPVMSRFSDGTDIQQGAAVTVNMLTLRSHTYALNEPETIERPAASPDVVHDEDVRKDASDETSEGYRAILYNDDWHDPDDVILQVQKATGYDGIGF